MSRLPLLNRKNNEADPFFDGTCPLCAMEMQQLTAADHNHQLTLVDIYQPHFSQQYPHIVPIKANNILHAQDEHGRLYLGLDATQRAWNTVGKKPWVNVLRIPVIRPIADWCYLKFARHRYRISWLLTGQKRKQCERCVK